MDGGASRGVRSQSIVSKRSGEGATQYWNAINRCQGVWVVLERQRQLHRRVIRRDVLCAGRISPNSGKELWIARWPARAIARGATLPAPEAVAIPARQASDVPLQRCRA